MTLASYSVATKRWPKPHQTVSWRWLVFNRLLVKMVGGCNPSRNKFTQLGLEGDQLLKDLSGDGGDG